MSKRPTGLTVFAVINFIFAGLMALSLIATVSSSSLREQAGVTLSAYTILSPTITTILLIVSGVGFLRVSYRAGFLCGMAFTILSLGNIMYFNAMNQFSGFLLHVPSMVYPTVLLLMLTLKYKQKFLEEKHNKSLDPTGDAAP